MSECKTENVKGIVTPKNSLSISDEFVSNLIYNSLLFENRDITLDYVSKIVGDSTYDMNNKKVVLIKNHQKAFYHIIDLVESNTPLTENILKDIHQTLMNDITIGGLYRNVDISINGSNHTPPSHLKVYDRMKKYFDALETTTNVLEKIAFSNAQLMKIHPFLDGNGRCARLVMNYYLMLFNYNPIIIPAAEKEIYFDCLESFKVNKDIIPFTNYITGLIDKHQKL